MKNKMSHTLRALLFLALALSGTGCSLVLSRVGTDTFVDQQLCPKDRIRSSYLAVKPQDVFERPTPPAEIADDPARLKVWTRKIDEGLADYKHLTLFDAIGCGAHQTYLCWEEENGDSTSSDFCDKVDFDIPNARFGPYHLKTSAWPDLKQRLLAGK